MNTSTADRLMFLAEKRCGGFILLACYFFIWLILRIEPILANTLHFDDFHFLLINSNPLESVYQSGICNIPPPDYRWVTNQIFCLLNSFFPGWPSSIIPILLSGLFLAAFSTILFRLLVKWSIPIIIALLIPLIILCHPITNEITLWKTTFPFSLWMFFCLAGFMLVDKSNALWQRLLGIFLLLLVVLSYEIYLIMFLVLFVSEPVINRLNNKQISLEATIYKLFIFIGLCGFYIFQVILTKLIFGSVSGRGFVNISTFSAYMDEKIHGIFNLIVNCYMPVMAYYTGIAPAWSGWKYIPVTIALTTLLAAIYTRRKWHDMVLFSAFSLLLPVLPTLPIFLMSQSPESWRVSIPVLLAVCLTLLPASSLIWNKWDYITGEHQKKALASRFFVAAVLLAIIGLQIPVTVAEAKLRVAENKLDASLMEIVKKIIGKPEVWQRMNFE